MDREPYGQSSLTDYSRSLELQREALGEIPEATSSNFRGNTTYSPNPMLYMDHAEGSMMVDVDGNRYIDFLCGVSSIILGHRPPEQVRAVKEQLDRGPYFGTTHENEVKTAALVNDILPYTSKTKFISTGTEAVMSAMRIARAYTGKDRILKFEGMYHGHHDTAMVSVKPPASSLGSRHAPTKVPATTGIPSATMETVDTLPWNDAELLAETLERRGDDIAAVITEAVMSNCGLVWPDDGYLAEVRRLTREHDVLLILDEVVTGFRIGLHGAQGYFDLDPDLAVYGKALANGYPNAAVTGRAEVMDFIEARADKASFSGTFSGNPVAVAATRANLERLVELGERGYRDLFERADRLRAGFEEIGTDAGHDVYLPEFAGHTYLHFHDGDSDPRQWSDWRDVDRHSRPDEYETFARLMIAEGVFFVPRFGRINLTHAHTDEDIDTALEAAKVAFRNLPA